MAPSIKSILISGANAGIGFQTAQQLAAQGHQLYLICRDAQRGQEALAKIQSENPQTQVELFLADLSDLDQVKRLGRELRAKISHLDVLVNNAGAMFGAYQASIQGWEMTFALNHLGYFQLAHEVLPLLEKSPNADRRIINVASMAHQAIRYWRLDDHKGRPYRQWKAYAFSKLCNILFTRVLAQRLAEKNITVNCLHPGVVATNFGQSGSAFVRWAVKFAAPILTKAKDGASTSVFLATDPNVVGQTGLYFKDSKPAKTTKLAQDMQAAEELWRFSEQICGIEDYGQPQ